MRSRDRDRARITAVAAARYGGTMTDRIGPRIATSIATTTIGPESHERVTPRLGHVPLLRRLLGSVLRRIRLRQGRTLRDVSADARVSLGYLSEVERGQKEASSELLGAICAALRVPQSEVLRQVSEELASAESLRRIAVAPARSDGDVVAAA